MKKLLMMAFALSLFVLLGTGKAHDVTEDLIADGGSWATMVDVGTVTISHTATDVTVEIDTTGTWMLVETHVHVVGADPADFPQNRNHSPKIGQFDDGEDFTLVSATQHAEYDISIDGLGDNICVAVHTVVVDTGTVLGLTVFSDADGNTTVTAGNTAGPWPHTAVDAWEAFGDPVDPAPSFWDTMLSYQGWASADWIWESYRILDTTVTQSVDFENAFTVPGYPIGGTLHITADDEYSVSLNGAPVGADVWPNWPSVEAYAISPLQGDNLLEITATNTGLPGSPPDDNPGGLIFEADITYLREETAWGGTWLGGDGGALSIQFGAKNWAAYMTHNLTE